MAANEELNEALRRAVEAETPAVLDAVLARADEPGREKAALPKRERRGQAAALGAGAAGVSAAAAVLALLLSPGRLPGGPEASLPGEPGGTFEATGFVMKAYSPAGSASSASQAQVLSPNEAVNLPAVDCGLASMIGKTALDGDLSLYKIHLPFEVVCEGEAICAVSYRTNTGWFERRLSVSHPADLEAFAQVVDVVNRTPSGAWGYAPLGDAIRFAYENQLMAHKQLSLQLSLTARRDASEEGGLPPSPERGGNPGGADLCRRFRRQHPAGLQRVRSRGGGPVRHPHHPRGPLSLFSVRTFVQISKNCTI